MHSESTANSLTLQKWLNCVAPCEFFQEYWGKEFLQLAACPAWYGCVQEAICQPSSNAIQVGDSDVIINGDISGTAYQQLSNLNPTLGTIYEFVADQARSIVVRVRKAQQTSDALDAISSRLSYLFDCSVNLNIYISNGEGAGLRGHYDSHHVFVVPIVGTKRWEIGDVLLDSPTPSYNPVIGQPPEHIRLLDVSPGTMLYIPMGMWHRAMTRTFSIQLTIGIQPMRNFDMFDKVLQQAISNHPPLRREFRFDCSVEKREYHTPTHQEMQALLRLLQWDVENR